MTFDEYTKKLATIQADGYLSIDDTILVKRKVVGLKKLHECSEEELTHIIKEYRIEYKKKDYFYDNQHKFKKSKNKYTTRKDWD